MGEATFTFRVDEALKIVQQQEQAAAHDTWLRNQVQAGTDAANAGEVLSADEVEVEARAWRAEMRRRIAAP